MPTSVLLAILAGAGLLALAPALVRRYDADERIAAERENSSARVLDRSSRPRTGPGDAPINPPSDQDTATEPGDGDGEPDTESSTDDSTSNRDVTARSQSPTAWERCGAKRADSVGWDRSSSEDEPRSEVTVAQAQLRTWWQRRHRRVLYVLLGLNLVELVGIIMVGPGFWIGFGCSLALLLAFLRYLRMRVLRQARRPAARRSALAIERQVYVPPQSEGERETESAPAVAESAPDEVEPSPDHHDEGGPSSSRDSAAGTEPTAPSRRRTGGIRGRSYESPANL